MRAAATALVPSRPVPRAAADERPSRGNKVVVPSARSRPRAGRAAVHICRVRRLVGLPVGLAGAPRREVPAGASVGPGPRSFDEDVVETQPAVLEAETVDGVVLLLRPNGCELRAGSAEPAVVLGDRPASAVRVVREAHVGGAGLRLPRRVQCGDDAGSRMTRGETECSRLTRGLIEPCELGRSLRTRNGPDVGAEEEHRRWLRPDRSASGCSRGDAGGPPNRPRKEDGLQRAEILAPPTFDKTVHGQAPAPPARSIGSSTRIFRTRQRCGCNTTAPRTPSVRGRLRQPHLSAPKCTSALPSQLHGPRPALHGRGATASALAAPARLFDLPPTPLARAYSRQCRRPGRRLRPDVRGAPASKLCATLRGETASRSPPTFFASWQEGRTAYSAGAAPAAHLFLTTRYIFTSTIYLHRLSATTRTWDPGVDRDPPRRSRAAAGEGRQWSKAIVVCRVSCIKIECQDRAVLATHPSANQHGGGRNLPWFVSLRSGRLTGRPIELSFFPSGQPAMMWLLLAQAMGTHWDDALVSSPPPPAPPTSFMGRNDYCGHGYFATFSYPMITVGEADACRQRCADLDYCNAFEVKRTLCELHNDPRDGLSPDRYTVPWSETAVPQTPSCWLKLGPAPPPPSPSPPKPPQPPPGAPRRPAEGPYVGDGSREWYSSRRPAPPPRPPYSPCPPRPPYPPAPPLTPQSPPPQSPGGAASWTDELVTAVQVCACYSPEPR